MIKLTMILTSATLGWWNLLQKGNNMNKYILSACLAVLVTVGAGEIDTLHAQTIPAERVMALETIRFGILKGIGAKNDTVEVGIDNNVFSAFRVNSNLNDSSHAGRNNEAAAIAEIVSKGIKNGTKYDEIHTIRVQYMRKTASGSVGSIVDTVDFRKSQGGVFELHAT